jgi:hypothetical protein
VKLGLLFGSVVFLIAGITLASNSSKVMGQSDMEKAKDLLSTAANATAKDKVVESVEKALRGGMNSSETTSTVQDKSFKILSSNDFIDSDGYLHVVGEVENNNPSDAKFVRITGTFYDTNNQVVATDFTFTSPSDIGSGQKAPFEITLRSASIPVSQIDHYNLQASSH